MYSYLFFKINVYGNIPIVWVWSKIKETSGRSTNLILKLCFDLILIFLTPFDLYDDLMQSSRVFNFFVFF